MQKRQLGNETHLYAGSGCVNAYKADGTEV